MWIKKIFVLLFAYYVNYHYLVKTLNATAMKRKNVIDFMTSFPDEESAVRYYEKIRWGDKVVSPFDPESKVYKCKNGKYKCKNTGKYFTYRTGTFFANSKLSMRDWLYAIIMIVNHKNSISSYQLADDLDISPKTSWYMLHRIRTAMSKENHKKLSGEIEVDETFVGGKNINRHKNKRVPHCQGRSYADKTPVFGMLERGGRLTANVIYLVDGTTLNNEIARNVEIGSIVYTDGWHYGDLHEYVTRSVDHGKHFYGTTFVTNDGEVIQITTNRIENAWSILKRTLKGTYIQVSRKHLQKYVDEFVFRYNTRKISKIERFELLLRYAAA